MVSRDYKLGVGVLDVGNDLSHAHSPDVQRNGLFNKSLENKTSKTAQTFSKRSVDILHADHALTCTGPYAVNALLGHLLT